MSHPMKELTAFMITENQRYGLNLNELKKINEALEREEAESINSETYQQKSSGGQFDLAFLYRRESDKIGQGIALSDYPLAKQLRQKEEKRQRPVKFKDEADCQASSTLSKDQMMDLLEHYHHAPKQENALFTTTSNEFGSKKPTLATYTATRHSVSQAFTRSFNNVMFRDHGLNTSNK